MEIERKWVLEAVPDGLGAGQRGSSRATSRSIPPGAEVRVRRKGDKTLMTVKTGIGLVRGEEEWRARAPSASSGCGR